VRQQEQEEEELMADVEIKKKDYDERIYHRRPRGFNRTILGLILLALVFAGTYLAATKELPFSSKYEVNAVFENAANIRKDSPVRIAGVNVGKVVSTKSVGNATEVTFTVDDEGQPVRQDSTVKIRPRIFLEGNFFLDLQPGTPSSPELKDGGVIPIAQTATAVQLDEILTSLQAPSRENLQLLLEGYGTALNHIPTAQEDIGQDPAVKGKTGGEAIAGSFRYGGAAGRDTAIVNQALLGTEPHDLSGLIAAGDKTFSALVSKETQLQDLITNFNTTAGAFASEAGNLQTSIRRLGPTVTKARPALLALNNTFPDLRAFARDIEPGVAELPATISAATPWLAQARPLLSNDELGYIAKQLRLTGPSLGTATNSGTKLFKQIEQTSRCVSQVLIPTGDVQLNDAAPVTPINAPNFKEFFYAAVGLAGESQNFDGNGPYVRFQSGGGPILTHAANPNGGFQNDQVFGNTISPPLGSQPSLQFGKPTYRTDVPCSANDIPDLNGPVASPGPPSPAQ
jgi:phospholipid/cholesterol/gamma-HCH transport system substrate-binding protein